MDTTEDGRGHQVAESFGKYAGRADSAGGAQDSALLLLDIVPRLSIYISFEKKYNYRTEKTSRYFDNSINDNDTIKRKKAERLEGR